MKRLGVFSGILISLALLVLLFFRIDWAHFSSAFRSANYWYVTPIIIIIILGAYLRALRWYWIILPVKEISVNRLFAATVIGYLGNVLLPAHLGEFLRAHVIGKQEGISRTASFATIIVERLFDGLSILIILALILLSIKIPAQGALITAAWFTLLLYLLVIAIIFLFNYKKELVLKFFDFIFYLLPKATKTKLLELLESLAEGFKIVEKGHHLLIISAYSFLIWAVTALAIYLMVFSFGYHISYPASLFVLVLLTFAVMIPSSPGFVGTFDAGMTYGLMIFAVPREVALSTAILYHGLSFLPIIVLGFYYLGRHNLSLGEE